MHARQEVPEGLRRLASLQALVVTREQALAHRLSGSAIQRLVRDGIWRRLASGVYLTAAVEPDWRALAWAGVLIGGDHARLGGESAGFVHRLVARPPAQVLVLVPERGSRPSVGGPWCFRREGAGARDSRSTGDPPSTTSADTLLDLVAEQTDAGQVTTLVTAAVSGKILTPGALRRALQRRSRLRHRALVERLLGDVDRGAHSFLELRYLHDVERAHGLPVGRRQLRIGRAVCDVTYAQFGLVVELDGTLGHTGMDAFRDMARDNSATGRGLATLRYGHVDVIGRPCDVALQVAHNLGFRGWPGSLRPCQHCRARELAG